MAGANSSDSPLDNVADAIGERTTETFSLLGNDTRLAILLALWEDFNPVERDNGLPFSELRNRVGIKDSGQFNYHLGKLESQLVAEDDDVYQLTNQGLQVIQSVIAGTAVYDPTLETEETSESCPRCGAPVMVAYRNEITSVSCSECEGWWPRLMEEGSLFRFRFPPAGLRDRTPTEVLHATMTFQLRRVESMMDGVCPMCGGSVETRLEVCRNHDATDGPCDECGTPFLGQVSWRCLRCKNWMGGPSWAPVITHPSVVSFYYGHGIEHDHSTWAGLVRGYYVREELIEADPPRMQLTFSHDNDELSITLDNDLHVVDVTETLPG